MKADSALPGVRTGDYIYGRNARFCLLVLYTGMRIGEAYALTWKDIDFKNNTINIDKTMERIKVDGKYQWLLVPLSEASTENCVSWTGSIRR